MKIPLAYAAGEDFHTNPYNSDYLPDYPDHYYRNLDFSDLIKNAKWAKRIYDNPGVDTDGDGYAGEIHICVYDSSMTDSGWVITKADTFYYTGDGIPDWKAAAPPPPPVFWIEPTVNGLRIRFNGSSSETEKDIFSKIVDFEGYRIYLGRDEREASFSLVASFDNPNYDKYVWNPAIEDYELRDIPFTLDSLRCLYGKGTDPCNDSTFDPLQFNRRRRYLLSILVFLNHYSTFSLTSTMYHCTLRKRQLEKFILTHLTRETFHPNR